MSSGSASWPGARRLVGGESGEGLGRGSLSTVGRLVVDCEAVTGMWQQVYQYNSTTLQVPTVLVRPLFGWKEVDSFSVTDEERERPAADIYTTAE
jgi:hypothetical protein